jgi:diacylglycerol O-acyltransferase / wax synthase
MKNPAPKRSLSAADAAFLYLERKEIPLAIASVSIFDGAIPFDDFVACVASKLRLIPRYRQIVVTPPWNLGLPTWEHDKHFDIHRHIFRVTLDPPGRQAELEAFAGRILSQLLDRSKPLWDIHVVDGLEGGRGAIIWRVHHALADGVSGAELLNVMLDSTRQGSQACRKPRFRAPKLAASNRSLADGVGDAVSSTLSRLIAVEKGLFDFGQALFSDRMWDGLKGLLGLLPELAASVERLPFNKPCRGERKFCWTEVDFADVQAIRAASGGTVNDVVLTVLTRALARYVKLHGQTVVNRFVRIVCPVSLRKGDQHGDLGNQISFLPVALPMGIRNPVQLLKAVTTRTETMKRAGAAHMVGLAASGIAAAPPALQALFWRGLPEVILPVPLLNMICTNVPGSPVPLYTVGRRMLACYPQVPTGYDLGVNCAVQSYDGKLFFGLIADTHAAPDADRLRDFLSVSFLELCRSAGVKASGLKKAQHKSVTVRRTRARRSKSAKPGTKMPSKPATELPSAATAARLATTPTPANTKDAA